MSNATFNNISVVVSFIGGGNRRPASHWQLYHIRLYRVHLTIIIWTNFLWLTKWHLQQEEWRYQRG